MKPEILNISDPDFIWVPGNKNREREVLLATIEKASEIIGNNWFIELGTFKGINARNFIVGLNKLHKECQFVSVDFNPFNKRLHFYPKDEWKFRCDHIVGPCVASFFQGKTIEWAPHFSNETVAWLFVDACHCFECVTGEIKAYAPKMISGGYMLFHDTETEQHGQWVTHVVPRSGGVKKALRESIILHEQFNLIANIKTNHGTQVWQKK